MAKEHPTAHNDTVQSNLASYNCIRKPGNTLCGLVQVSMGINPLTSVSHWSGFKVKLTFMKFSFLAVACTQILGILCLQIDLFLIVECIWYNLGHV